LYSDDSSSNDLAFDEIRKEWMWAQNSKKCGVKLFNEDFDAEDEEIN